MKQLAIAILFLAFGILSAQNANDCTDAIVLCGDTPVGIQPSGVGFDEFSLPGNTQPPCYSFNNQTAWFKVEIEDAGSFTFDLVPENPNDDYDFAVYGPVADCQNLGNAIRCSSTHPPSANVSANTGLNDIETDTSEGPGGDGNGYLKAIDASAGETYYILIDRASGSSGFNINLTGSATSPKTTEFNNPEDLEACSLTGSNTYSLDLQRDAILQGHPDSKVTFHSDLGDANLAVNELPDQYTNNVDTETLFARIFSDLNACSEIVEFQVSVAPDLINDNPGVVYVCDFGNPQTYNLASLGDEIIRSRNNQQIEFYRTSEDRDAYKDAILSITIDAPQTPLYYRIYGTTGSCELEDELVLQLSNPPKLTKPSTLFLCTTNEASITIDLNVKTAEVLNGQEISLFTPHYYTSVSDRENDQNRLTKSFVTTESDQQLFLRVFDKTSGCYTDSSFEVVFLESPEFELDEYAYYCIDSAKPFELSISDEFTLYEWSTGETGDKLNTILLNEPGTYSVTAYNEAGCSTTKRIEVLASEKAQIERIEVTGLNYPRNEVQVVVQGSGTYEFALDGGPFVEYSTFTGISRGYHQVVIKDQNGCGSITSESFLVLDYPRFFTPNGDGIHDTWELIGLEEYPGATIAIYNRYGKLIKQLQADSSGWDGTFKNQLLKPDDFWFVLQLPEGIEVKGHFSLLF